MNNLKQSFVDKLRSTIVFIPQQKGIAEDIAADLCERVSDEFTLQFTQWMNEPVYRGSGELGYRFRCIAQAPQYKDYIIIDKLGLTLEINGKRYFTLPELLQIYKEQYYGTR
jgi:hypothetical protein